MPVKTLQNQVIHVSSQPYVAFLSSPPPVYIISNYRKFEPNERHVNRLFHTWVLLLIFESALYFTENGVDVELSAGEWYIQRPGLLQEGRRPCPAPRYYYVHFNATAAEPGLEGVTLLENGNFVKPGISLMTLPVRGAFPVSRIQPLCEQLERQKSLSPSDYFSRQATFLEMLTALSDTFNNKPNSGAALAKNVMEYLSVQYAKEARINQLSEYFHFSTDYLSKVFKQNYGIAPKEYIQQLRISMAIHLLDNTRLPVARVAASVGYQDLSVFFRTFKSRTGYSPAVWRKRLLSK